MTKQVLYTLFLFGMLLVSFEHTNNAQTPNSIIGINFIKIGEISLTDGGVPEISAYDPITKYVFSINTKVKAIEVIDISNPSSPNIIYTLDITPYGGNLNSVAVKNGKLAIAIEGQDKVLNSGQIVLFDTNNLCTPYAVLEAGYLPDNVCFTPDGKYVLSANEGEPNDTYTNDPEGSISIVDVTAKTINTLTFDAFNNQEKALQANDFRVFGQVNGTPSTLSQDVEPEYIAISNDSKTAWVSLQENNGFAKIDIPSQTITAILPLGVKDFSIAPNSFDLSDKDEIYTPNYWPVKSYFMPDAIDYFEINGTGYIISANEGDVRDYSGFSEEQRVKDIVLDPTIFPNASYLQDENQLGRLKITTSKGDTDDDGDFDELYGYGARSYSIWSTEGVLVYDSGNTLETLSYNFGTYPKNRSDDKGTEPEAVEILTIGTNTYAIIGLERSGDVFIFDISTPTNPVFIQQLPNTSPEGILAIPAREAPNGKTMILVSNESDEGKLSIYSL